MRFRKFLFLLLIEAVKGYLREISIGVFVEMAEQPVYGFLNESAHYTLPDDLLEMELNITSVPRVNVSLELHPLIIGGTPDPFHLKKTVCSLLTGRLPILISLASCQTTRMLSEIVSRHHVPVLHSGGSCARPASDPVPGSPFLLPLVRGVLDMEIVVLQVVRHARWREVIIFYDGTFGPQRLSALSEGLSLLSTRVMTIDASQVTGGSLRQRQTTLQHIPNYIALCSHTTLTALFRKVRLSDLDLLGPEYFWLVMEHELSPLDVAVLGAVLREGDNVALLRPTPHAHRQTAQETNILHAGRQLRLALEIFAAQHPVNMTVDCEANSIWSGASHFISVSQKYWQICSRCLDYEILSFTLSQYAGTPHFEVVGHWHRANGLEMVYHLYPFEHQGFNQRRFIVTAVHDPPFNIRHPNGTWSGVVVEMLEELAFSLNFSYEIRVPPDGQWGIRDHNGTFTGMLGMLQRKEVDFGVGIFTITDSRLTVADFTSVFMIDKMIIVMKKPDLSEMKMFLCLGPFSPLVWFSVVAAIIVVGLVAWFVTRFHPLHGAANDGPEVSSIWVHIWQIMGAILQQGMIYIPSFHSSRIVIALWWLFTIVVVGTYNGNLIAFLTAPKVDITISSLEDLVNSNMRVGLWANTAMHDIFLESTTGVFKDVWDMINSDPANNLASDVVDGFMKTQEDINYAFLIEKSYLEVMRKRPELAEALSPCDFLRSRDEFFPSAYAFPFQKHSPYVHLFSKRMLQILEAGLLKHWRGLSYGNGNPCTGLERTTEQTTISLAEAQGAFYILGIGLVVGILALFAEWIHTSCSKDPKSCIGYDCARRKRTSPDNERTYYVGSMAYTSAMVAVSQNLEEQRKCETVVETALDVTTDSLDSTSIPVQVHEHVVDASGAGFDIENGDRGQRNGFPGRYTKRQARVWQDKQLDKVTPLSNGHRPADGLRVQRRKRYGRRTSPRRSASIAFGATRLEDYLSNGDDVFVIEANAAPDVETGEHLSTEKSIHATL